MRRALKLVSQGAVVSQPKHNVFNDRFNCPRLSHSLKLSGNVFHRRGPAAAKHRSPKLLYEVVYWHIKIAEKRTTIQQYGDW